MFAMFLLLSPVNALELTAHVYLCPGPNENACHEPSTSVTKAVCHHHLDLLLLPTASAFGTSSSLAFLGLRLRR